MDEEDPERISSAGRRKVFRFIQEFFVPQNLHGKGRLAAAGTALLCLILCCLSPIDGYKSADPRGSLMVSQAVLRHGTVTLDVYPAETLKGLSWQKYRRGDRWFYSYPLGTSLFSLPFVALADLFHMDMGKLRHEVRLQRYLAALTVAAAFWLVYLLGLCYLPPPGAAGTAALLVLGGNLASTMGVALFSMNFTVLFLLASLLLLARDRELNRPLRPWLLGSFLFAAYICRPTSAVFILAVLLYLFFERRPAFLRAAAAAAILAAGFTLFSFLVYGSFYPGTYQFAGRALAVFRWEALYGNLLSPSRGLLVFSPFLIVVLIGLFRVFGRLRRDRLFLAMGASVLLHFWVVSRWACWWGGGSFGPRLLTDAWPALILVSLAVFRGLSHLPGRARRGFVVSLAVLGSVSVLIHAGSGLFNRYSEEWNYILPPTDAEPLVFDWRHPQFLAGPDTMPERMALFGHKALDRPLPPGKNVSSGDSRILFQNFDAPENSPYGRFRWSLGKRARIWFKLRPGPDPSPGFRMLLRAGTFQGRTVHLSANGVSLGQIRTEDEGGSIRPERFLFKLRAADLGPVAEDGSILIALEFEIPDARPAFSGEGGSDRRRLGIRFFSVKLKPLPRPARKRGVSPKASLPAVR